MKKLYKISSATELSLSAGLLLVFLFANFMPEGFSVELSALNFINTTDLTIQENFASLFCIFLCVRLVQHAVSIAHHKLQFVLNVVFATIAANLAVAILITNSINPLLISTIPLSLLIYQDLICLIRNKRAAGNSLLLPMTRVLLVSMFAFTALNLGREIRLEENAHVKQASTEIYGEISKALQKRHPCFHPKVNVQENAFGYYYEFQTEFDDACSLINLSKEVNLQEKNSMIGSVLTGLALKDTMHFNLPNIEDVLKMARFKAMLSQNEKLEVRMDHGKILFTNNNCKTNKECNIGSHLVLSQ
ncbi:hypothetical protein [Phaeobacter inhibens]|uniref:hypothetical protein n=1 Tax=Phaeobacter inhibens TaxID=221822 RepID=UPI000C9A9237|nr:hypothetical protein [Phaeobacter inhibens]AUQ54509.1 hypothetical protein PhaeoP92_01832 [Phaeobacter inhibens]AUQ78525.1 hypothetical protein PhaeoP74_01833 [Phaeobacter inhibens]AUR15684.1 hypothetical protein PhaeoP70_01831 [Phaeobacter inhibens]